MSSMKTVVIAGLCLLNSVCLAALELQPDYAPEQVTSSGVSEEATPSSADLQSINDQFQTNAPLAGSQKADNQPTSKEESTWVVLPGQANYEQNPLGSESGIPELPPYTDDQSADGAGVSFEQNWSQQDGWPVIGQNDDETLNNGYADPAQVAFTTDAAGHVMPNTAPAVEDPTSQSPHTTAAGHDKNDNEPMTTQFDLAGEYSLDDDDNDDGYDAHDDRLEAVLSDVEDLMDQVTSFLRAEFRSSNTTGLQQEAEQLAARSDMLSTSLNEKQDAQLLCDAVDFVNEVQRFSSLNLHDSDTLKWNPPKAVRDFKQSQFVGMWYKVMTSYITWYIHDSSEMCTRMNLTEQEPGLFTLESDSYSSGSQDRVGSIAVSSTGELNINYTQVYTSEARCWPQVMWLLAAGPVVNGKYDWAVLADPFKMNLEVLARDPDFFAMSYDSDVRILLSKLGFVRPLNQPIAVEQSADVCLEPRESDVEEDSSISSAANEARQGDSSEKGDDKDWIIVVSILSGFLLLLIVVTIGLVLRLRRQQVIPPKPRVSGTQVPLIPRNPSGKFVKNSCAYCLDPHCHDLECQNLRGSSSTRA